MITPRPFDAAGTDNLDLPMNALQRAIAGLGAAIFDETAAIERDVQTVRDALVYLKGVRRRLRR